MDVHRIKGIFVVYEELESQYAWRTLSATNLVSGSSSNSFHSSYILARTHHNLCKKEVVKKWIPQYGVTVLKNSEIYDFVKSRSNTEKEVLTSKRNWLVLFLEWNLLSWPSYASANFLSRATRRTWTIPDLATFRFGTWSVCLTTSNGSASFAIGSRSYRSLHRCESLRFGWDISVRSII